MNFRLLIIPFLLVFGVNLAEGSNINQEQIDIASLKTSVQIAQQQEPEAETSHNPATEKALRPTSSDSQSKQESTGTSNQDNQIAVESPDIEVNSTLNQDAPGVSNNNEETQSTVEVPVLTPAQDQPAQLSESLDATNDSAQQFPTSKNEQDPEKTRSEGQDVTTDLVAPTLLPTIVEKPPPLEGDSLDTTTDIDAQLPGLDEKLKPKAVEVIDKAISGDMAPQIMSSDLNRKQKLHNPTRLVQFIIVDDDEIKEVFINNVAQQFDPANTVLITKKFKFSQGKSLVRVKAVDERGNIRERSFLVGFGARTKKEMEPEAASKFYWKGNVRVHYETDDNPTNDMSSPMENLQGVISLDEQTDTRVILDGRLSVGYDNLTGFFEVAEQRYQKATNDFLNSRLMIGRIGYKGMLSNGKNWLLDYTWIDINVGDYDYALVQALSPGLEFRSRDNRGAYRSLLLGVDIIQKDFAAEEKTDGVQSTIKLDYKSLDEERLHLFQNVIAYGNSSEGSEESEYTFIGFDFDWENKWQNVFQWDFGFGFQRRYFKKDEPIFPTTKIGSIGEKHVDIPLRFSTGLGWEFSDNWKVMYDFKYLFNFSNKVSYLRRIYGLVVYGEF